MGMDLKPIDPSPDAPRDSDDDVVWGRYNWSGWSFITGKLAEWGALTDEFAGSNDGKVISAETCKAVADAIEKHLSELDERDRKWLAPTIERWRTCGGYEQW